jgi:hypothetical protein
MAVVIKENEGHDTKETDPHHSVGEESDMVNQDCQNIQKSGQA